VADPADGTEPVTSKARTSVRPRKRPTLTDLVSIDHPEGEPFCNVQVTLVGRQHDDDATPETLFLEAEHPLVRLIQDALDDEATHQFEFWECPGCRCSMVLPRMKGPGGFLCARCTKPNVKQVWFTKRPVRDEDVPEGRDARKEH
jgi:hypothetical protein